MTILKKKMSVMVRVRMIMMNDLVSLHVVNISDFVCIYKCYIEKRAKNELIRSPYTEIATTKSILGVRKSYGQESTSLT